MKILAIETSCDETAISVLEITKKDTGTKFDVLGSVVHSQIDVHKEFGGVVPNLARREHEKNLPLVLEKVLRDSKEELKNIDKIIVTVGPGLEPALWTGILFAQKLGEENNIEVIGANHMEGHIASVLVNVEKDTHTSIDFPAIALLISGGHTELIHMKDWQTKEKIGETRDDAVGEAFDKVARMMDLPYPGGPEISKLAEEGRIQNMKLDIDLPRPMIHSKDFDFSFSGLKTAVLYYIRDTKEKSGELSKETKIMIAREFEDAVIETLLHKTKKAIEKYVPKTLIIGGGVIANKKLKENFINLEKYYSDIKVIVPEKSLATDNATMIGVTGYIEFIENKKERLPLKANGNLSIG